MTDDFGEKDTWDKFSQETEIGHAYKFIDKKYGPQWFGEYSFKDEKPTHCILLWNSGDIDKEDKEQKKAIKAILKHFPSAHSFKFYSEYEMYVHDFYPFIESFVTFVVPGKGLSLKQEIKQIKKEHVSLKKFIK
jgi:hypothetical protein